MFYIDGTKNNKAKTIMPSHFVISILKDVKRKQKEHRLKAGSAWVNEWDLAFTNKIGHHLYHLYPQTILKRFKAIAAQIGKPNARFHDLRYTYAATSLQEGNDIKAVQENLCHAIASFTLNVCAHESEKMKKEYAARMVKYIANILIR